MECWGTLIKCLQPRKNRKSIFRVSVAIFFRFFFKCFWEFVLKKKKFFFNIFLKHFLKNKDRHWWEIRGLQWTPHVTTTTFAKLTILNDFLPFQLSTIGIWPKILSIIIPLTGKHNGLCAYGLSAENNKLANFVDHFSWNVFFLIFLEIFFLNLVLKKFFLIMPKNSMEQRFKKYCVHKKRIFELEAHTERAIKIEGQGLILSTVCFKC